MAKAGEGGLLALIAVVGLLIYSNALSSPFLFDDQNSIIGNTQIRRLMPLSVPLSPPRDTPVAGRPFVNLSFALNYAVGGLDPWGYHLTNISIHIAVAMLLFAVVRRASNDRIGLASALIWLVHPLNTEAVNYFSQRTESLMALFYLLTFYCAMRDWRAWAIVACALGMACKESMVTAPLAVMLYDRTFTFDSWKAMWRARRGLYLGLASTWLVLAVLLSSTPRTSVGFDAGTSPLVYLWNQFEMIARYLWLTVWPRDLVLDYGLPRSLGLSDVLPQAALVVALGVATIVALVRWPKVGFLLAWFFITLAPTSSIVPIATEVGAERRMYLPLMGLVVLLVVALFDAARAFTAREIIPVLVVILLLAAGTIARNREYASTLTMAHTIVDRWPSGRGHYLLGTELLTAGRRAEGMAELRASAMDYPGARYAIGTELLAEGQMGEAIEELETFIRALPAHANVAPARDMLGRAYAAQGRFDRSTEEFERLLKDFPNYPARADARRLLEQVRNARFPRS